jgi:hypothetical protein
MLAGLIAKAQEDLVEAAKRGMVEAKKFAEQYRDTGKLQIGIHAVYPNTYDDPAITTGPTEAAIVMTAHRESDNKDYAWFQENGPAGKEAGLYGRHYLATTGYHLAHDFPNIEVGEVRRGNG